MRDCARPTLSGIALALLSCSLLAACTCGGSSSSRPGRPSGPRTQRRVRIKLLSTHDLHGQMDPLTVYTREAEPRPVRVGGAEALAAQVAELRAGNPGGTILLDAGDSMQGSLLSNTFEGAPVRDVLRVLKTDAAVVGNHDLDFGPVGQVVPPFPPGADPQGALRAWTGAAPFPVLTANILDRAGRPVRWPNVRPFVMLVRQGIHVGVVGLTTPATAVTTLPVLVRHLRFAPLLPAARREARALRRAGAMVVVLLIHANGWCEDRSGPTCRGEIFKELLSRLEPGLVDAVVAGHSHQCLWHTFRGMFVVEACSRGVAMGQVELVVDTRLGRVDPRASRVLPPRLVCHDVFEDTGSCEPADAGPKSRIVINPLLARHPDPVAEARRAMAGYRSRMRRVGDRLLARVARPLLHRRMGVSGPGTLFARAMLEAIEGADFALLNSGAIRADLRQGELTFRLLYEAMPFDNLLASVRLSGAQLVDLLRRGMEAGHGIFQVAGIRLTVRCAAKGQVTLVSATDSRVGRPVDPKRLYSLVLNDFLLSGGDDLGAVLATIPDEQKRIHRGMTVRDAIIRYLHAASGPVNTATDPVVVPEAPPIVVLDGTCDPPPRRRPGLCR